MANKALYHFLVIFFLALSNFFFISQASRFGSLMERPHQMYRPQQKHTITEVKKDVEERMGLEVNDYPGSGANNRHVPRQQYGRGCVIDC